MLSLFSLRQLNINLTTQCANCTHSAAASDTSCPIDIRSTTVRLVTRQFTSTSSSSSSSSTSASLSHGYELCRGRQRSRENPTMHIFSVSAAAAHAVGKSRSLRRRTPYVTASCARHSASPSLKTRLP